MAEKRDYYEVLGVAKNANRKDGQKEEKEKRKTGNPFTRLFSAKAIQKENKEERA